MSEKSKILIGKIVAAQGLGGDVRVQTFTSEPSDLQTLKIENIDLKFIRTAGRDVAICKISGINDRNAAEELRGTELFINRESLPALPNGEYYQTDLIGMTVIINGEEQGKVESIQNFGAGDILEMESGKMISFIGANVDIEKGIIVI
ncbi:MAG: 16S rRNA processing protein RimM [Alphaproteobacteria bacterium]|nr:16S rRNA processing protein RimM [Alphaproteobacteria bacterium]MBN2675237.1 16S rRNA processing protein RimM [Alphaproteobacteria bacterium]